MEWMGNLNEYEKLVIRMNTPRFVFWNLVIVVFLSFFFFESAVVCSVFTLMLVCFGDLIILSVISVTDLCFRCDFSGRSTCRFFLFFF